MDLIRGRLLLVLLLLTITYYYNYYYYYYYYCYYCFIIIAIIIIIIFIIIIIIIIIIIRVLCVSGLFFNSSFSVLCSTNFEVMKLAVTRYDEISVDIHPFLILNMEKPKILSGISFGDNKNSLYKLFLQTIITQVNQFINYEFNQF